MSDYLIYCDDFQEGIWFQSLDDRLADAELEVIPSQKAQIERLGLYNRMFKAFSDGIVFRDSFVTHDDL